MILVIGFGWPNFCLYSSSHQLADDREGTSKRVLPCEQVPTDLLVFLDKFSVLLTWPGFIPTIE